MEKTLIVEFKPREVSHLYRVYVDSSIDKYTLVSVHTHMQGKKIAEHERVQLAITGDDWMNGISRYVAASEFMEYATVRDIIVEKIGAGYEN